MLLTLYILWNNCVHLEVILGGEGRKGQSKQPSSTRVCICEVFIRHSCIYTACDMVEIGRSVVGLVVAIYVGGHCDTVLLKYICCRKCNWGNKISWYWIRTIDDFLCMLNGVSPTHLLRGTRLRSSTIRTPLSYISKSMIGVMEY